MTIALAFVVGMLVVVVAGLAWIVREQRRRLDNMDSGMRAVAGVGNNAQREVTALKADHEKLVRSLRNQRGIVDGG